MDKDKISVGAIWILLTLTLEWILFTYGRGLFAVQGSEQAAVIDDAFMFLSYLAMPIFAMIVAIVGYSVLRFRSVAGEDAAPARFHGGWAWSWLIWSSLLCLLVIITPGFTGLQELRATQSEAPDVVVEVTGQRWQFTFYYPEHDVWVRRPDEVLTLPNHSLIRFNVTSLDDDVLHSFWIPAFRQKIDAVPGLVTSVDVTTNRIGGFDEDVNYRVQCAELCGVGHSIMTTKVRVVEEQEFLDWVAESKQDS